MSDTDGLVSTEVVDGVGRITLNNPATLNALSPAMVKALTAAFDRVEAEARVIVLTGAGRAFCSGADLGDPELQPGDDVDGGRILEEHYNPLMLRIRDLRLPLITRVNGIAAGVGAALALAGDIIVAEEGAAFVQSFGRVGLVPDGGAAFLLTRAIGRVRALELMLLGEKLPARRAFEWGLVTRIVAAEALDAAVDQIAAHLASGATFALASIRRMTWGALDSGFEEQLAAECGFQRDASRTADFREGVAAFTEKRRPRFTGG